MTDKILDFRKTGHFLHSQWDRGIDDHLLYKVLPFVESTDCEKDLVFVMPCFLTKRNIGKDDKQCLIIVIRGKWLVTVYWCDHPNYLFDKNENAHFQILY